MCLTRKFYQNLSVVPCIWVWGKGGRGSSQMNSSTVSDFFDIVVFSIWNKTIVVLEKYLLPGNDALNVESLTPSLYC